MTKARNYPLLLASQFLGALGDNVILTVILGQLTFRFKQGMLTEQQLGSANAFYTTLLFIPYFLLAPLAGFLNDRFAKSRWLLGGNAIKVCGSLIAAGSLILGRDGQGLGYFIVGVGACIYSPAKYGILPEILPAERLVKANGTVEMLTLIAILLGNLMGAKMIDLLPPLTCYAILLAIYLTSLGLNFLMTETPSDSSVRLSRSLAEFIRHSRTLLRSVRLGRVLLGTIVFWICGAVLKMNFQPWGLQTLQLKSNTSIALLGLWLSIGVMIGSILAGQLHQVGDLRATRFYGWFLAGCTLLLATSHHYALVVGILVLAGVTAGLFLIPLNATLQAESDQSKLGKTIATQNFLENLAMSLGGALVWLATASGATAPSVFLLLAALVGLAVTGLRIPLKPAAAPRPATANEQTRFDG